MTHGDLFAGLGSFSRGLHLAGIDTVFHVEIDPACRAVLRRQFPGHLIAHDIRECGAHNLPHVDLLTFGSPCQDLSVAGLRAGLKGARSGLFFEAIRLCTELKPDFAIWENVPGALSSNAGRDFAAVLRAFQQCGARDICWRILDAQYVGVAQRRRRVFVVADFRGERAAEILFEPQGVSGHPPPRRQTGQSLASTLTSGSGVGSNAPGRRREDDVNLIPMLAGALGSNAHGGLRQDRETSGAFMPSVARPLRAQAQLAHRADADTLITNSLTARYGKGTDTTASAPLVQTALGFDAAQITSPANRARVESGLPMPSLTAHSEPMVAHALTSAGADASEDGTGRGVPLTVALREGEAGPWEAVLAFAWQQGVDGPKDGSPSRSYIARAGDYAGAVSATRMDAIAFQERGRAEGRRLETQEDLAYALTAPAGGGRAQERSIASTFGVRRLTPTECERLQGLPDGWTALDETGKPISDSARYRMIGNAGCVFVLEWIGRRLLAAREARQ